MSDLSKWKLKHRRTDKHRESPTFAHIIHSAQLRLWRFADPKSPPHPAVPQGITWDTTVCGRIQLQFSTSGGTYRFCHPPPYSLNCDSAICTVQQWSPCDQYRKPAWDVWLSYGRVPVANMQKGNLYVELTASAQCLIISPQYAYVFGVVLLIIFLFTSITGSKKTNIYYYYQTALLCPRP